MLPLALDAQFGTPYPRSAGFDTDIGAFIESSTASSPEGRMSRLVFKDGTTIGGALAVGQTLRLGGFIMTACSAAAPTMTSRVIENSLHVKSALAEQMDPIELTSLKRALGSHHRLGSRYGL